jgi:hypothetical protein
MTMDQNLIFAFLSSLQNDMMHNLHYFDGHLMLWSLQIFPVKVVVLYPVVHEKFRSVAEAHFRYNSISTIWMFSRLLQVKYSLDPFFLELFYDVMLLN